MTAEPAAQETPNRRQGPRYAKPLSVAVYDEQYNALEGGTS